MDTCKSPSHKNYRDTNEMAEVSAKLLAQKLDAAFAEDGPARVIAIERWFEEAEERAKCIKAMKQGADVRLRRHFARGCHVLPGLVAEA